jgi:hypothetical protein
MPNFKKIKNALHNSCKNIRFVTEKRNQTKTKMENDFSVKISYGCALVGTPKR